MGTNLGDIFKKLHDGEMVKCFSCGKGEYKPLSEDKKCCHYKCSVCEDMIRGIKKLSLS